MKAENCSLVVVQEQGNRGEVGISATLGKSRVWGEEEYLRYLFMQHSAHIC